jgi:glycosyltransferase involved in cell wall biosynthesis
MDDVRWFSSNRYGTLPVAALTRAGLRIALEGDRVARVAFVLDGQSTVAGFEFSRRHGCPLILKIPDVPPWRLDGGRPDFVLTAGAKIVRIPRLWGRYPERPGYYSRIRYVARHATAVWCPSTNSVRDVLRYYGVPAERLPFCYDSDRFRLEGHSPSTAHRSPFTILSISRLVPHKNHALLLRAAARLEPRPLVRILGEGREADNLRRIAASLRVPLEMPGTWATDEEIREAYASAGVVVAPSRFEGFGLTPMEGVAMGIPVIASDIPPHREFLEGAVQFFQPDDDEELARLLGEVIAQPPNRPAALPTLLSDLTIEACAARLLPALQRVMAGTR